MLLGCLQKIPSDTNGQERRRKDSIPYREGSLLLHKNAFGLKNVRATYQRLVDTIFEGQMGRILEAYVDDMVIKSKTKWEMIKDVEETLLTLKKVNLKLNPKKCSFKMEEANEAVGAILLVERDRRQTSIPYVRRTLEGVEINYPPMEKLALELVHAARWLRRYFQGHTIKAKKDGSNNTLTKRENPEEQWTTKTQALAELKAKQTYGSTLMEHPMSTDLGQAKYLIREIHIGTCGMHDGLRRAVYKAMNIGYFWPKKEPANFALMAIPSSSSSDNEDNIIVLTNEVEARDNYIITLKQKLSQTETEKDDLKLKFDKFQTSSKSLTKLLANQTNGKHGLGYSSLENDSESVSPSCPSDRVQPSGGYNAVPPPITGNFMPLKHDLVFHTAPIAVETDHSAFTVQLSLAKPTKDLSHTNRPSAPIIKEWVYDSEDDTKK
nr:hypothetical protein [Tanacetum cinerariifolium]